MKIILSLEKEEHFRIAEKVQDYVDGWKVNHIGWDIVAQSRLDEFSKLNHFSLSNKKEVFFDCKLFDNPNTVKTVVERIIERGATMTTICTLNNLEVFHVLKEFSDDIKLLGVSFLTSWKHERQTWAEHVEITEPNGFKGMVCSARDIPNIKSNLLKVCPGITFGNNNSGQVRTTTPKEAQDLGADYIVIGRAVTESEDPIKTIKEICAGLIV